MPGEVATRLAAMRVAPQSSQQALGALPDDRLRRHCVGRSSEHVHEAVAAAHKTCCRERSHVAFKITMGIHGAFSFFKSTFHDCIHSKRCQFGVRIPSQLPQGQADPNVIFDNLCPPPPPPPSLLFPHVPEPQLCQIPRPQRRRTSRFLSSPWSGRHRGQERSAAGRGAVCKGFCPRVCTPSTQTPHSKTARLHRGICPSTTSDLRSARRCCSAR